MDLGSIGPSPLGRRDRGFQAAVPKIPKVEKREISQSSKSQWGPL